MKKTTRQRRTRLFIAKRLQIKYIGLILLFMFIAAVLTGYTVYVTTWVMFGEKLAAVYPQGILIDIVKKVNMVLFTRLLLLTPIVILIGLVLSNRIAGALYSIKRFLKKVSSGHYENRLSLRRNDELQDMAKEINHLVDGLSSDRRMRKKKLSELKKKAREVEDIVKTGGIDREKLLALAMEIREELDSLKY